MSYIFKFGWRNLFRNKMRSFVTILAIAGSLFLTIFVDNLQTGSYQAFIRNGVQSGSGHLALYHPEYLSKRETKFVFDRSEVSHALQDIRGLRHARYRLNLPGLTRSSRNSAPTLVLGMEIDKELGNNPNLKPEFLIEGNWPRKGKLKDAVVGYELAEKLSLKLNKKFVVMVQDINGQVYSRLYKIRGLLKTGMKDLDQNAIILDLKSAQRLLQVDDKVHELAIVLESDDLMAENMTQLKKSIHSESVGVFSWREAMPQLISLIELDRWNGIMMASFLFLIVGIGIVNTMVLSITERSAEFGILRAMGMNPSQIRAMVLCEGAALAMAGIFFGVLTSTLLCLYTGSYGIDFSRFVQDLNAGGVMVDPIIYTAWNLKGTITLCTTFFILSILASIYPAWLATKIVPALAIREGGNH